MHVAGYIDVDGKRMPVLYHVRNVDIVDDQYKYHRFEESLNNPPLNNDYLESIVWYTRNGNFRTYAYLFAAIEEAIPKIAKELDMVIPYPSLTGQVRYNAAWIRFIANIYDSTDKLTSIGGTIHGITIDPYNTITMPTFKAGETSGL